MSTTGKKYRPVKAYKDPHFLNSSSARPLRVLSEYFEPQQRFDEMRVRDTIVFFGSARILSSEQAQHYVDAEKARGEVSEHAKKQLDLSRYYEATRELARRLTEWSKGLKGTDRRFVVCSGGGPGIMEAANKGASDARGQSIGLGISLPQEQHPNPYITRELSFEFHYFFMRKFWFSYLAKAMIVMPGGFGTLDEFMEVVTLVQTKKIHKPLPIVFFGKEFWDRILNFEPMIEYGTINPEDVKLFHYTDSVDDAFDYLTSQLTRHALQHPGGNL